MKSSLARQFYLITAIAILTSIWSGTAWASSLVTISPAGDGVFQLQGVNVENAAAFDITVAYDRSGLENPRVTEGSLISGSMVAVNTNVPGTVRMAVIRTAPIAGSGTIATLTFGRKGNASGKIISLSARLSNIDGKSLPVLTQVNNPVDTVADTASPDTKGDSQAPSSGPGSSGGSTASTPAPFTTIVVGPSEKTQDAGRTSDSTKEKGRDSGPLLPSDAGKPATALQSRADTGMDGADVKPAASAHQTNIIETKSILECFKDYKGVPSVHAFTALFDKEIAPGFLQDPLVALADGKTSVKVIFLIPPGETKSADVAVVGSRLISVKKDAKQNSWVVELIPEKGIYKAGCAISLGNTKIVYPLTIAPKADKYVTKSGKVGKSDFERFIRERKTSQAPSLDLNHDRKVNYIDDYILTVNYLVSNKPVK